MRLAITAVLLAALLVLGTANATYIVTAVNTTVSLKTNTSAYVSEILRVSVSNTSVSQYTQDRLALNLTLSQWQNIIGPELTQHILNPKGSIYDFGFVPGPLINSNNGKIAYLQMIYLVTNVTTVNETAPRTFVYSFNNDVFNFQHAESGVVLGENTTLTIILPQGAKLDSVYPPPDSPAFGFSQGYRNATSFSWYSNEPLSKFDLTFTVEQSLQGEVLQFFEDAGNWISSVAYLLLALAIAAFIVYTYYKVGR